MPGCLEAEGVHVGGQVEVVVDGLGHVHDADAALGTLLGPPIVSGNLVATLRNGDEIFPAMLEAINGAQRTVTFETYIYWSGDIGKAFAEVFAALATLFFVRAGDTLTFTVKRGDSTLELKGTPELREVKDPFGNAHRLGVMGITRATSPGS